jgi:hypothetical protein
MIEWIAAVVTSLIGAGAGTAFDKLFNKPTPTKSPTSPDSPREMARRLVEIRVWQGKVERMLLLQDRQIRRLRRQIYVTRLMLDVFLVLVLAVVAAWYYFSRSM